MCFTWAQYVPNLNNYNWWHQKHVTSYPNHHRYLRTNLSWSFTDYQILKTIVHVASINPFKTGHYDNNKLHDLSQLSSPQSPSDLWGLIPILRRGLKLNSPHPRTLLVHIWKLETQMSISWQILCNNTNRTTKKLQWCCKN